MKRHATILTLLPASILRFGVEALAHNIDDWDTDILHSSPTSLADDIARLRPSLLIADPSTLHPADIPSLRESAGGRMRIAALYFSALSPEVTAAYDDAISIYADAERLASVITSAAANARHSDTLSADTDTERMELSPREKEVVVGVVKGMANKEIAAAMGVSVNTITTHRRNIAAKLKIHSPAGLTIYAIVSKLVTLDEVNI